MRSEVLMLERRHVDLAAGTLRLDRSMNGTGETRRLLVEQLGRVDALQRQRGQIVPWVFPHLGPGLTGERRRDFRKAWKKVARGVSERVAMAIIGHKTRSMFDRYHIVSPGDLAEAARRMDSGAFSVAFAVPTGNPDAQPSNMQGATRSDHG